MAAPGVRPAKARRIAANIAKLPTMLRKRTPWATLSR